MTAIAIFGLATITSAQVPSYVPKSGLVGWWPFNGNATDESSNTNDGNVNGATLTKDRFGSNSSAYTFDGSNDYISMPTMNNIPMGNSARTLSVWMNPSSLSNQWTLTAIGYGSPSTNNAFMFGLGNNIISVQGWATDFSAPLSYTAGQWIHAVCTYDSLNVKIYVNGTLIDSGLISTWNTNGTEFYFGARPSQGNSFFPGQLDDIGIWNRALDSNEVKGLFLSKNCKIQITQSGDNTSLVGSTAKYTVSSPDYNPKYQWQANVGSGYIDLTNAGQYAGVNDSILLIKNITKGNNNQKFRCYITTDSCSGNSTPAALFVNCVVTQQPRDTVVLVGDKAVFSVYSVDQNAQYQWQIKNGAGFIDLTNAGQYKGTDMNTLEINNVSLNNNSTFRCKVTSAVNSCSDTTTSAKLVVSCAKLIQTQPQSIIVPKGSDGNFQVASKTSNTTYQWQINTGLGFNNVSNGGQFSGATTSNLNIKTVTFANDNVLFRCLLKDSICLDTTTNATLAVTWAVGINNQVNSNSISVFPNPSLGQINVKTDAKLLGSVYTIYDNTGKLVLTGRINSENTVIDLGNLSGGIYLFSVGENLKQTFKVIKE